MAKDKSIKAPSGVEKNVSEAVDQWFSANLANSVVSRDTDVHNLLHAAKPALVQAIVAAVSPVNPQE